MEAGRVEKPGKKQGAIRVGGQGNRVQDDSSSNLPLLVDGDVCALQAGSHAARAEAALGNLPETVNHGVEDEVIRGMSEAQAAPEKIDE